MNAHTHGRTQARTVTDPDGGGDASEEFTETPGFGFVFVAASAQTQFLFWRLILILCPREIGGVSE